MTGEAVALEIGKLVTDCELLINSTFGEDCFVYTSRAIWDLLLFNSFMLTGASIQTFGIHCNIGCHCGNYWYERIDLRPEYGEP